MAFDAFISYSHAADGRLAPALQRAMQRLAKPWYRLRALRVFRDESALSANPHLWSSIQAALDESEWFVLFASPDAVASQWVNRELEYWLDNKSADRVLAVVTDGSWDWDRFADVLAGTAVLRALHDAFSVEPRHVDLRWAHDADDLNLRNSRFRDVVAQLAAPVHGVAKDDLEGEDIRQHRRTIHLVRAVGLVLVVLTVVAVIAALAAMRSAQQARRARDDSDFQRVVAQSENLKANNPQLALLLAVEARHLRDTPQSRGALQAALVQDPRFLGTIVDPSTKSATSGLCPFGDHDLLVSDDDGTVRFVDVTSGDGMTRPLHLTAPNTRVIASVYRPASALGCAASANGKSLAVFSASGSIWSLDPQTQRVRAQRTVNDALNDVALAADGTTLAVGTADGTVLVWSIDNLRAAPRVLRSGNTGVAVAFSPDGGTLASTTTDRILLWDTTTWTQRGSVEDPPSNTLSGGLNALPEPDRTIRFSSDGHALADGRGAATRMLDLTTRSTLWTHSISEFSGLAAAFAPKTGAFYTITQQNTVARDDATTGVEVGSPFSTYTTLFAISGDGSTLLAVQYGQTAVDRWALDGRGAIGRRIGPPGQLPGGYSPDGRTMLTQAESASFFVAPSEAWDVATGRHLSHVPTAAFPNLLDDRTVGGYFVALGAETRFDLRTGQYVGPRFRVPVAGAFATGNDSAGNVVVSYTDGSILRYEPDGKEVGNPWLKLPLPPNNISVSPHGLVAMSTFDFRTSVYHLGTGKLAYPPIDDLFNAQFSPDGNLLGGLTRAGKAVIRDASTGMPTGPPIRDTGSGTSVLEFGANHTVALESPTSARIYDLHTGEPIGESFPITHWEPFLRPDGLQLATATADGVVVWDLNPNDWERAACQLAGGNLTRQEWATYFPNSGPYRRTCPQWPAAP